MSNFRSGLFRTSRSPRTTRLKSNGTRIHNHCLKILLTFFELIRGVLTVEAAVNRIEIITRIVWIHLENITLAARKGLKGSTFSVIFAEVTGDMDIGHFKTGIFRWNHIPESSKDTWARVIITHKLWMHHYFLSAIQKLILSSIRTPAVGSILEKISRLKVVIRELTLFTFNRN